MRKNQSFIFTHIFPTSGALCSFVWTIFHLMFFFCPKTSLSTSCNTSLLAMNSFTCFVVVLSENIIIFYAFCCIENFKFIAFFFQCWSHSNVFWFSLFLMRSQQIIIFGVLLYVMWLLFWASMIFSLSLVFWHDVSVWFSFLFGVSWASWNQEFIVFIKYGKIFTIISSNISSSWNSNYTFFRPHGSRTMRCYSFFFSCLTLCFGLDNFLSPLIILSAVFNALLNISSGYFISHMANSIFSTHIILMFFFKSLNMCTISCFKVFANYIITIISGSVSINYLFLAWGHMFWRLLWFC